VVSLPNPSKTSLQFDFSAFRSADAWAALFGMWYLVFLDSTGGSRVAAKLRQLYYRVLGFWGLS
jgi:hypothetical protein